MGFKFDWARGLRSFGKDRINRHSVGSLRQLCRFTWFSYPTFFTFDSFTFDPLAIDLPIHQNLGIWKIKFYHQNLHSWRWRQANTGISEFPSKSRQPLHTGLVLLQYGENFFQTVKLFWLIFILENRLFHSYSNIGKI